VASIDSTQLQQCPYASRIRARLGLATRKAANCGKDVAQYVIQFPVKVTEHRENRRLSVVAGEQISLARESMLRQVSMSGADRCQFFAKGLGFLRIPRA
jgi:hypothetical protein